jgi:hypothetical protein
MGELIATLGPVLSIAAAIGLFFIIRELIKK